MLHNCKKVSIPSSPFEGTVAVTQAGCRRNLPEDVGTKVGGEWFMVRGVSFRR